MNSQPNHDQTLPSRKLLESPFRIPLILFLSLVVLIYTTACSYFQVARTDVERFERTKQHKNPEQYRFFIHHNLGVGLLSNVSIRDDLINGDFSFSPKPIYNENYKKRILKDENQAILQEVHIYLKANYSISKLGAISIPTNSIDQIKLINRDTGKDFLSFIGATAAILTIVGIIYFLTKSSCPYVYSYNGEEYTFEGEIYSGAVLHNLERHDYLPLNSINPVEKEYRVKISNELHERQYINLAELFVVNHPEDLKVLFNEEGNMYTFGSENPPIIARSGTGQDLCPQLIAQDTNRFLFDEVETEHHQVLLSFEKPASVTEGKLLLKGKNSLWGDYLYGEFAKKFGNRFNK